jgi:hypothetical protein
MKVFDSSVYPELKVMKPEEDPVAGFLIESGTETVRVSLGVKSSVKETVTVLSSLDKVQVCATVAVSAVQEPVSRTVISTGKVMESTPVVAGILVEGTTSNLYSSVPPTTMSPLGWDMVTEVNSAKPLCSPLLPRRLLPMIVEVAFWVEWAVARLRSKRNVRK